jgi:2-polyprenyl-3-methyl-5-hydroxy-6-metoxy-1,4-benzoquinol methylase
MVYANPVPEEFASGQYYDQTAAAYYLSAAKLESDYARVRFDRELRLFRKYCRRGTVLDVGCSTGGFLAQLQARFPGDYEVLGTDVSGPPLDFAQSKGIPVARGNFREQDFAGKQFDAVTFWAVLEHLADPQGFLAKACEILKPGAYCFALTPNLGSLAVRLLGPRYRYIYPQHLNYFTRNTLTRLVQLRFSVVASRSMHFNPIVIWQDLRGAGKEVTNEERASLLKRTTGWKQKPWLWPLKFCYSLVERTLGALTLADNLALVLRKQ